MSRPERLAAAVSLCSACSREHRVPTRQELDEFETVFAGRESTDAYMDGKIDESAGAPFVPERDDMRASERAMSAVRRGYGNRELRRVQVEFFSRRKAGPAAAGRCAGL